MRGKLFAGFAAALAFAMTTPLASAMGPITVGSMGGGTFGSSGSAMRRITVPARSGRNREGAINGAGPTLNGVPFPTNDPDHYHEIKLIGRFAKDESGLTIDQQTVWMRVDGRTIPMAINGDAMSNSLQLDQGDELGQTLYRLILSRQLQVVGDEKLRAQIFQAAAANPANARPIEVDGFVYDRTTPYLVLVSVGDAL
jgi:hypothetical protein